MQIMMAIDADQRTELEIMINDLEEENRFKFSLIYLLIMT